MATYAQFKHVELYKIGHGKNRVPNAPKSCIGEIFSQDSPDNSAVKNGSSRPRVVRDTPTRPRDTHSRLFGQVSSHHAAPMVTDTIRSNIQFGDSHTNGNGISPSHSPSKQIPNGSAASTPSRGEMDGAEHCADPNTPDTYYSDRPASALLEPQPTHRYFTRDWPPKPAEYYVESTSRSAPSVRKTPYTLLGLKTDDPDKVHPVIDPDSLSPQLVLDRHWPPFPAQHYLEPTERKIPHHPLPPYAFVSLTSALGDRPTLDYKYNPIPSLDGPIDPYLIANNEPPHSLFKYERDGPIPDVSLLETNVIPGPHTLTGFPPIFHKHVPGYLFNVNRHAEDFRPKTYYVDYVRQREMEGNPITGDGYKSMNGQINTVTSVNGSSYMTHSRVPPGGFSSGLW
ncbi:microtubule-Associated protein jupiter domain-containing protein [Phthorimaea operculella]|nr:microtubule-Associated protein jupiter domain-containing protein [Phthorimaea operculella]